MADSRIDALNGIINELNDRIKAEPSNPDLPPLLANAEGELATLRAAEKAAQVPSAEGVSTAISAAAAAPGAASAPAVAAPEPSAASAAKAAPAVLKPAPRPAPTVARSRPTLVAGSGVKADGTTSADHPSRLRPAARPAPAGPQS